MLRISFKDGENLLVECDSYGMSVDIPGFLEICEDGLTYPKALYSLSLIGSIVNEEELTDIDIDKVGW